MIKNLIVIIYKQPFFRFLVVGGIGFLTNAVVFYLLKIEMSSIFANIFSYLAAVFVTWLLNRMITFHSHNPDRAQEWLRYVLIYLITGSIQFLIFTSLIKDVHFFHKYQLVALMITAISIAILNYVFSKRFAFIKST